MHLFINSVAATAGGGLTYMRNVIPHLAAQPGVRLTVAAGPRLREEVRAFDNVGFLEADVPPSRRFWHEQVELPRLIRNCRADILLSAGNFAVRRSPVPQILLSRNSIYTSADYFRDLQSRHEYRAWLETRFRSFLAKKSISWADITVAPSEAFAQELRRWTGRQVIAVHHGFDQEAFTRDSSPLALEVEARLRQVESSLKLLFVSHYNYYRNFETLISALPLLRERLPGRSIRLLLTCQLAPGKNPGAYRPNRAANLVKSLGLADTVVELGTIPYQQLHHLYTRADIYVSPAYTETFAHPLAEAMASGLPVVASDLAVHREVCGGAALYFPRFSPEDLATCVARVAGSSDTSRRMADIGRERSNQFSWKVHVAKILELARTVIESSTRDSRSLRKSFFTGCNENHCDG